MMEKITKIMCVRIKMENNHKRMEQSVKKQQHAFTIWG